jgi:hypothetical protein
MTRVRDNWAPCSFCGEPVEQDDAFRIIDGDIVHEGDCADEHRLTKAADEAAE